MLGSCEAEWLRPLATQPDKVARAPNRAYRKVELTDASIAACTNEIRDANEHGRYAHSVTFSGVEPAKVTKPHWCVRDLEGNDGKNLACVKIEEPSLLGKP